MSSWIEASSSMSPVLPQSAVSSSGSTSATARRIAATSTTAGAVVSRSRSRWTSKRTSSPSRTGRPVVLRVRCSRRPWAARPDRLQPMRGGSFYHPEAREREVVVDGAGSLPASTATGVGTSLVTSSGRAYLLFIVRMFAEVYALPRWRSSSFVPVGPPDAVIESGCLYEPTISMMEAE